MQGACRYRAWRGKQKADSWEHFGLFLMLESFQYRCMIRSLMNRSCFLVLLSASLLSTSLLPGVLFAAEEIPAASQKWVKDMDAFAAQDATNPPPKNAVLFIGSSSIRKWKTLAEDFPDYKVINRGFGGSQIIDSVVFADRIAIPYHPRLIIFYAGSNDIATKKSPQQVFADYQAFVKKIHAALPETKIDFIAVSPNPKRWAMIEQVKETNRLVEEYCKTDARLQFINTYPLMLGEDGQPKPDIFVEDKLHMNAKGYAIWREAVLPYLKQ